MKNLTALLALLSFTCYAQLANAQFFKASVNGGFTFSQVDGDYLAGYDKAGIFGGISIFHELNDDKRFGFDIQYAQKGSKKRIDPKAFIPAIFIIKSSYVEFPMWVDYKIQYLQKLRINTGLSIGVLTKSTFDDGFRVAGTGYKKLEVAYLLGASYELTDNLNFNIRHSFSLTSMGDLYANGIKFLNRAGIYNRLFYIGLSYRLKS
ncbi:MAG: outer membrane beta-barrel protein [Flavobacteriales bacterium]|nr:outer membrane beta-barrel protein [Flavobacteriales bacterium]